MKLTYAFLLTILAAAAMFGLSGQTAANKLSNERDWNQWRGPNRDGQVDGPAWPERLTDNYLVQSWRVPLGPSYSGPVASAEAIFITETKDKATEVVRALSRQTGKELWKAEWAGAISVPFFAKSRGDWIRATPAYDGKSLFVAGMRDVLVSLDAKTGKENWRVDFSKEFGSHLPEFGLVCSPLVDGEALFIQAGNAVVKLDKRTGKTLWRAMHDDQNNIMSNGAFSSPVLANVAGTRQLLVQSREQLAGLDPATGKVLWSQTVPSFRGMNILTPVVVGDAIFTSSYQNKSWLYQIAKGANGFTVNQAWENNAQGYMSTPVVVDGHAYLHLGNQRFTCINLKTGERTWTSKPFGKYVSLIAQRDRLLALDERGVLLLIKANPKEFELLSEKQVAEEDTWAHLGISGEDLFIRELNALSVYRWQTPKGQPKAE